MATPFSWEVMGGRRIGPAPFCIFGIVNATPDSFYDGGQYDAFAVEHAKQLVEQGAHVLDIGGESSRPYADPVSLEEELERVLPVVQGVQGWRAANGLPWAISVDTYKAQTAAAVLEKGADIINDISACDFEPELADVIGQYKPGYVLMHSLGKPESMQNAPRYDDVVSEILSFFAQKMSFLVQKGLPEERIMLDPGIGFGKTVEHNIEILQNMHRFAEFGRPLMAGLSNKSLFKGLLGLEPDQRQNATQATTAILASRGVQVHRVHDVALTAQSLAMAEALTIHT